MLFSGHNFEAVDKLKLTPYFVKRYKRPILMVDLIIYIKPFLAFFFKSTIGTNYKSIDNPIFIIFQYILLK